MLIASVVNFRDFGGLRSRYGGTIRRDKLYRSGSVRTAAGDDLNRLMALDFAIIADLRYPSERLAEASPWPASYTARVLSHDGDTSDEAPHMGPLRDGSMTTALAESIYTQLYKELPFDPYYRPLFSRVLSALPAVDGRTLIHCSAGKDRTGMLVALVQHALGVSRADIVADFLKSRDDPGLQAMIPPLVAKLEANFAALNVGDLVVKLMAVEEHWLLGCLDEIEARCGSIDAYLDSAGLDERGRERLRERLLLADGPIR